MTVVEPVEGSLRVWHIINPPNRLTHHWIRTVQHAVDVINALAVEDLRNSMVFYSHFGLEAYEEGSGWVEWYDEEDRDIMQYTQRPQRVV